MAGSYRHCVSANGRLRDPVSLNRSLDTGGDVYEAIEHLYGMIWWLAQRMHDRVPEMGAPALYVSLAEKHYQTGLASSPMKRV